jgi:hypothetical protein
MIIENEHGKNEEYAIYDMMGHPVQPRRGGDHAHAFFMHTMLFKILMFMMSFK